MAVVINGTTGITTPTESVATTIGVGGATPSASGAGVTFPATQSTSSNANTLDDYEEGTWTVEYQGGTTNPTVAYDFRTAVYTKVGNLVTFAIRVGVNSTSSGSGTLRMSLPFTAAIIQECSAIVGLTYNWSTNVPLNALIETATSSMVFYKTVNSSSTVNVSDLTSGARLWITGSYYTS